MFKVLAKMKIELFMIFIMCIGTFIKRCTKYTYEQYCDIHLNLQRNSCEMYHFLHDRRLSHISDGIKAEVIKQNINYFV